MFGQAAIFVLLFVNVVVDGFLQELENCSLLDLTHPFNDQTIEWPIPGQSSFRLEEVYKGETKHGVYISTFKYSGPEHAGTHWDAPSHFAQHGLMPEKVELSTLIGEACVVNVEGKVASNPNYQLSVNDLSEWETANGQLDNRCVLLVATGWDERYAEKSRYLGIESRSFHFPGIHPDTAQWLIDNRPVRAIGIDSMSVDYGMTPVGRFQAHQILAGANMPILESLRLLTRLPPRGATVVALPMKIEGGSGGPVRVVAFGWTGDQDPCRRDIPIVTATAASHCRISAKLLLSLFGIYYFCHSQRQ
uniref:Kynurenine formamidase n=1 Tax=Plectus sambesii TaxID=2011161 RepID=A0A914V6J3_9BILA